MTNLLDIITPVNLREEKEKFLSSKSYNPVFHYSWQDASLEPTFSIKKKYFLWEAIRDQDSERIVKSAFELFEVVIDNNLRTRAEKLAKVKKVSEVGSAQKLAQIFHTTFAEFDLNDYSVEIVDMSGFNMRPKHGEKKITISQDIQFGYFSMEGEVKHEMVHIVRYVNGKYNRIKRSQRFLPTEEGLASWCQDHAGSDNAQAQHAIEYVASFVGLKGSLREVYECMRDLGMDQELAWKRASRHKFGFVDTSIPGDILKPAMYFANEMKIEKLTTDEQLRLFVGKINQDELSGFPKYSGKWDEEMLVEYFKL